MSDEFADRGAPPPGLARSMEIAGVPPATGPWARAVEWHGMVFISGLRGIEPATGQPAATIERRLELIFEHLALTLAAHGSNLASVAMSRVYVTDMAGLRPLVNAAYERAFGPHLPTRTIVEVAGLNQGDDVEIEFVAIRTPAR